MLKIAAKRPRSSIPRWPPRTCSSVDTESGVTTPWVCSGHWCQPACGAWSSTAFTAWPTLVYVQPGACDQPVRLDRLLFRCQHLVSGVPGVCTCQDPATGEVSCGSYPSTSAQVFTRARGPGGTLATNSRGPHPPAEGCGQNN